MGKSLSEGLLGRFGLWVGLSAGNSFDCIHGSRSLAHLGHAIPRILGCVHVDSAQECVWLSSLHLTSTRWGCPVMMGYNPEP